MPGSTKKILWIKTQIYIERKKEKKLLLLRSNTQFHNVWSTQTHTFSSSLYSRIYISIHSIGPDFSCWCACFNIADVVCVVQN